MATKKQRRRRQKGKRHEYEYVYVDDEGNEVEGAEAPDDEAPARSSRAEGRKSARPTRGGGRQVQPPSWRRVGKRGLIFAPLMFVVVTLLAPDTASPVQNVLQTLFLLLVFLPFSYVMDSMTYRMWRRRTEGDTARKSS